MNKHEKLRTPSISQFIHKAVFYFLDFTFSLDWTLNLNSHYK
jgi:hypothetical protein